ncbi:hypothetical protein OG320_05335 [Microbispora sp. NBC_01189]|uniref:hypothetical protein n=1 Tax=Microbispora sp. NBC_01189 TaxID=2903583 RepID=UPI002E121223|nr:hypothetical protein OG320_05335 [Microbispora sp. NBC_01189]
MSADPSALVESLTADEARMFATYVAGLAPRSFDVAASLIERDRVAFGHGLAAVEAPLSIPRAAAPVLPAVPRGVTPLYDWAAEGDFPHAPAADDLKGVHSMHTPGEAEGHTPGYVPEALPDDLARQAASRFLADVVTSEVPSIRRIKIELGIGQDKAQQVRAYLATLADA